MSLFNLALVAAGSAFGGSLRYLVGLGAIALLGKSFPWGTLIINVSGSFLLGVFWALLHDVWTFDPTSVMGKEQWQVLLAVGVTGGYTTFSTFEGDL